MSDIIVVQTDDKLWFSDPLDDSGDGDACLDRQTYYTKDDIVGLLNDLGFNVSDET